MRRRPGLGALRGCRGSGFAEPRGSGALLGSGKGGKGGTSFCLAWAACVLRVGSRLCASGGHVWSSPEIPHGLHLRFQWACGICKELRPVLRGSTAVGEWSARESAEKPLG